MIYEASPTAVIIFFVFVGITLGLSFYFGKAAKSSEGFFAASGGIPWFINGVAFAGDYLSAASFLGICGMIAFYGYDGFLYSIGYLAGWIVALFVIAEPLKRLGKYTFADALDAKFDSRGIKLAAGISTLVVSVFYLIPQMVGAGALITPLLGFPHEVGVLLVGVVVILIVVTAGMVSTTYVQFLKGSLLVVFSFILTVALWNRGYEVHNSDPQEQVFPRVVLGSEVTSVEPSQTATILPETGVWKDTPYVRTQGADSQPPRVWREYVDPETKTEYLIEAQTVQIVDGQNLVNGLPQGTGKGEADLQPVGRVLKLPGDANESGALGPISFFSTLGESTILLPRSEVLTDADGVKTTVYYSEPGSGRDVLSPGNHPSFKGLRDDDLLPKINFLSLMLALFCGTASLPHILIRYYTVKDQAAARKSTIVGIASIGFFYILTLYLGLGAMTSGALDPTNTNMSAPLLARSMSGLLFAIISAIAFTTVLGTVSGLIIASSGAVVHDLMTGYLKIDINDGAKVRVGKIAAVAVGAVAILLGILFEEMNVNYLVGWAFSIAASANLPSLVMLLFWKRTTKQGITAAIVVGMLSSLGWILLSADTFSKVYGLNADDAIVPFSQPGIVTIPLGFLTLVAVSLMTQKPDNAAAA